MLHSNNIKYSLIIPCYNEVDNLDTLIENCKPLLINKEIEIVLVNNGSTDGTIEKMSPLSLEYENLVTVDLKRNLGYGGGIISGLKVSRGEIIGWTHADNQTSPMDFLEAIKLFKEESPILVKGYRYGRSIIDYIFSYGMGLFETVLLKKWLVEINAQPTVFTRSFYQSWMNPPSDFSLDLYVYYMAIMDKIPLKRIKVHFGPRLYGESKWNLGFKSKLRFIKRTIKFSFELKRKYR